MERVREREREREKEGKKISISASILSYLSKIAFKGGGVYRKSFTIYSAFCRFFLTKQESRSLMESSAATEFHLFVPFCAKLSVTKKPNLNMN
jgi:hypothetical protein